MQLPENAASDNNAKPNFYKVATALNITPTMGRKWWKEKDDFIKKMKNLHKLAQTKNTEGLH